MNVNVRVIEERDFDDIITLADASLGIGYLHKEQLRNENQIEKFGFIVREKDELAGFVLNEITSFSRLSQDLSIDPSVLSGGLSDRDPVGLLHVMIVHPSFQKKGIASTLMETTLDAYQKREVKSIAAEAWRTAEGLVNIEPLLKKYQFMEVVEIQNYWKDDSLKNGYACTSCGFPCVCSAVIYVKGGHADE